MDKHREKKIISILNKLLWVLIPILIIVYILSITDIQLVEKNNDEKNSTNQQTYLEPMEMTERERRIYNALGSETTLAYQLYLPNIEEFKIDLWIEYYHNGEKQENQVDYQMSSIARNENFVFILQETPVYERTEKIGYVYKSTLFGEDNGGNKAAVHSKVSSPTNNLTLYDKVKTRTDIEFNKDIILATKIESKGDYLKYDGIFSEDDPNFETMINDAREAYIYKIKITY
ncbi:hypothetical protein [Gracilibacillus salinarum]|uniref:Uncharacterized protein n=1 Tax=Gracilibacillus salinarum TaxID=2932255 RepID=A0ABY4GK98_9BACI|nr:hypothetical protein [Gracilibacillus salinarum]UOQ84606.1 hypothetical protein MUN87_18380 [Gracilibacillus salinarum]